MNFINQIAVDSPPPFSPSSAIIIPAAVALLVSGLTLLVTYITSDRRAKYDAAFEAAKYREKWLSNIREEFVEFVSNCSFLSLENKKEKALVQDLTRRKIRLELSIPKSNPNYDEFEAAADEMFVLALKNQNLEKSCDTKPLMTIADNILKSEWDDIQQLLATGIKKEKKKTNNA